MSRRVLAIALGLALAASCAKQPSRPRVIMPPPELLLAVHPGPLATRILPQEPIWARFAEALDPASISDTAVFFKVDTRRLAKRLRWDADSLRLYVEPVAPLTPGVTYTVELTPRLRTASGASLAATYRWQFTLLSVRVPASPTPADGAPGQSPFATLLWDSTEISVGSIAYDIYAGPDSASVAARAQPPVGRAARPFLVPGHRWAQDGATFWAVSPRNLTTGESLDGPVWRLQPCPESTPVDSVVVPLAYTYQKDKRGSWGCDAESLVVNVVPNPRNATSAQWDFSGVPRDLVVADVAIVLTAFPGYESLLPGGLGVASVRDSWDYCVPVGPDRRGPYLDAFLAPAAVVAPGTVRIRSDTLSAHVTTTVAHPGLGLYGYSFAASTRIAFHLPGASLASPSRLVIYVYRP